MDYLQARQFIEQAECYAGEMGLSNMEHLMKRLGHPESTLKFIHIAGTNGKGSVMAYISSVLECAEFRVGRYVSPTLYSYRERIQINGVNIDKASFVRLVEILKSAVTAMTVDGLPHPTPFEMETALAILYFKEQSCDLVVLECGLGGKDDATNIVKHTILAVLTSISLDHMDYLGDTLEEIAAVKAGIIKRESVVVTGRQQPEVEDAIWAICTEKGNPLIVAKPQEAVVLESTLEQQVFRYHGEEITISLAGSHQIDNAVLALECIQALNQIGYVITKEEIRQGFWQAKWSGRFTILRRDPFFVVDGAHNPDAALKLQQSIKMHFPDRELIFIMGVFKDKQYAKIAEIMALMAKLIYTVATPDHPRALPADILAETVRKYHDQVIPCETLQNAVSRSLDAADRADVIVAFGSLSFIGDVTKLVAKENEND